jgi:1,4-alpha-glucan branching enzyme
MRGFSARGVCGKINEQQQRNRRRNGKTWLPRCMRWRQRRRLAEQAETAAKRRVSKRHRVIALPSNKRQPLRQQRQTVTWLAGSWQTAAAAGCP